MKTILRITMFATMTMLMACRADTQSTTTSQTVEATQPAMQTHSRAAGIWIDVRTPDEFNAGHLHDAVNIPVEQVATQIASVAPDKQTPIHVYCRSGSRSEVALQQLVKLGYTNVTNQGGYQDLINKGIK